MPFEVTLADAYREATVALGEATVRERLLLQRVNELESQQREAAAAQSLMNGFADHSPTEE